MVAILAVGERNQRLVHRLGADFFMETISIIEARKILGAKAGRYPDSQIEVIINSFVAISDLCIDQFIENRQKEREKQEFQQKNTSVLGGKQV